MHFNIGMYADEELNIVRNVDTLQMHPQDQPKCKYSSYLKNMHTFLIVGYGWSQQGQSYRTIVFSSHMRHHDEAH